MSFGSPLDTSHQATPGSYLPSFLTGETSMVVDQDRMAATRFGSIAGTPRDARHTFVGSPLLSPLTQRTEARITPTIGKRSGPPTSGLFDKPGSPKDLNQSSEEAPSFCKSFNESQSFASPAQVDPFYTQGDKLTPTTELDRTWVTVFGFPPAASSYILQQLSNCGTIVEHRMSSNGNWMHIRFQSRLQAKKALSRNGKIFGGNIMVGVKPCLETTLPSSSPVQQTTLLDTSDYKENVGPLSPGGMRPLSRAYQASAAERDVSTLERTPRKNSTVVSKAMEYVFGW
ncbi:nucleoporin NUP35-like [Ornithodoros turicata]|uniref:nucleoporin NUP35-like n=1 Tax=Ornithodoros turicata TaxID=34597 RepID=UPI00313A3A99